MAKSYPTFCRWCGEDGEEIVIGEVYAYYDADDNLIGYGHPGGPLGQHLMEQHKEYTAEPLEDGERAPAWMPCSNCKAEHQMQHRMFDIEMARGGVQWMCTQCHQYGMIMHNDSQGFSAMARQQSNTPAPDTCTVRFVGCHQHATEQDFETHH